MITDLIRAEKKEEMDDLFWLTCDLWAAREYKESQRIGAQLHGFKDAFLGLDSYLFRYGGQLISLFGSFLASGCKTFEVFAMLKACQAFKGLNVDQPIEPDNIALASEARDEWGYLGGYVILFEGKACGWINELRDPGSWEPHVIAVDQAGNQFQAYGGDSRNGALHWIPLVSAELVQGAA